MHPAYSVILFTTASGAGYGLLALVSLLALLGVIPPERWLGIAIFGLAFSLVTLGLLSSTFHLGRPERAWRAFSQWRTSWLSREGVIAAFSYLPAGLFAIEWVIFGDISQPWNIAGWLTCICAIVTVWCTGMIYASLKTIAQWHHPLVAPLYVLLAIASGGVLLNMVLHLFGQPSPIAGYIALAGLAGALLAKLFYWRSNDTAPKSHTAEQATGLGNIGKVRALEPPHTQPNYVMREMGFAVARKHAVRLRLMAILFGFVIPIAATAVALNTSDGFSVTCSILAFFSTAFGMVIERWLFFAEARHVVTLYYGAHSA
jgi:DMSO reductase anchor subunit